MGQPRSARAQETRTPQEATVMPTFVEILDRALELALDEQAYEVVKLIVGTPRDLDYAWVWATELDKRRYSEIINRAYFELRGRELKAQQIAEGYE